MPINQLVNLSSPLVILLFGIASLVAPSFGAKLAHLATLDKRGLVELRVAFGGLFIGLGLITIIDRDPSMYKMLAAGWFGSAAARIVGIVVDRPPLTVDLIVTLIIEIAFGVLSLV